MNRHCGRVWSTVWGTLMILAAGSSIQAQEDTELYLISYPNANITVDGDPSDWNLEQFGTNVSGGVAAEGDEFEWEQLTGTGDIAVLGWDETEENMYYGVKFHGVVSPVFG